MSSSSNCSLNSVQMGQVSCDIESCDSSTISCTTESAYSVYQIDNSGRDSSILKQDTFKIDYI